MKFLLIFVVLVFHFICLNGQNETITIVKDPNKNYKYNNYFELAGMIGDNNYGGHASWSHLHGFGKKKRKLKIGYGVRVTTYIGINRNFITAPAKLTSGFTGPLVAFSDNITENIDTIFISRPQTNSINLFFCVQYTILKRWDLGINLDLIGVSFGAKKISQYSSTQNASGEYFVAQDAYPTGFNVFLTSDNSLGSLTSEAYLRFWINNQWSVKAAFVYAYSEYTTVNKLRLENDRYRNKMMMGSIGVTYCPWRSETFRIFD